MSGFQTVERKYPDMTVTDTFRVVEKYKSDEDGEGNCYDWYEIDRHSRDTDRFLPQKDEIQAQIDYLAMMTGVEMEVQDGEEG